jgi:hypothetical protein
MNRISCLWNQIPAPALAQVRSFFKPGSSDERLKAVCRGWQREVTPMSTNLFLRGIKGSCHPVRVNDFRDLEQLPNLETLAIGEGWGHGGVRVNFQRPVLPAEWKEGMNVLPEKLFSLEINLDLCPTLTEFKVPHLPRLNRLYITSTSPSLKTIDFSQLPALEIVDLSRCRHAEELKFGEHPHLRSLETRTSLSLKRANLEDLPPACEWKMNDEGYEDAVKGDWMWLTSTKTIEERLKERGSGL